MYEVMNIIKVAVGLLSLIGIILVAVTLGGCKLGASAAVEPPVVQTRVTETVPYTPAPPIYTAAPTPYYQPQLAK